MPDAADVAVIGGGLAGLTTAIRAREAGRSVVLIDPDPAHGSGSNSRISGGVFHLAWGGMDEPVEQLFERMSQETDGEVDPTLAGALARSCGPAVRWLRDQGVELGPKGRRPHDRFTFLPWLEAVGATPQPGRGAERAMARLRKRAGQLGVAAVPARAERLAPASSGGWVVNCSGLASTRVSCVDVVVASGGFQANPALMRRYVSPSAGMAFLRCTSAADGSGLEMLQACGAVLTEPSSRVYGHLLSASASREPRLWPQPTVDAVARQGLLVDRAGRAFTPDASSGIALVNAMLRTDDPSGFAVVFDSRIRGEASAERERDGSLRATQTDGHLRGVSELAERGAEIIDAPNVSELAVKLGVPQEELGMSVAGWARRSSGTTHWYAMRVVPGVTTTTPGIRIDEHCRVVTATGESIGGLFAAGDVVGVHGGPRGGYLGGLAVALITGYIAGATS